MGFIQRRFSIFKMQARISFFVALAAVLMLESSARTIDFAAEFGNGETERIIGGKSATEGMFPWATVLFFNGRFICSSSIISPRTILTAAHCVVFNGTTQSASSYRALANYRMSADEVIIDIANITPHPDYEESSRNIENDIAILTTTEDIRFSATVQPICIARKNTPMMAYRKATAMGWGDTDRNPNKTVIPDELQYVEQEIISNTLCRLAYAGMAVESSKICAKGFFNGICSGDSGGPLVHMSANQKPVEIGVASYINAMFGCGSLLPAVWTRVSSYNDFIMQNAVDASSICEI